MFGTLKRLWTYTTMMRAEASPRDPSKTYFPTREKLRACATFLELLNTCAPDLTRSRNDALVYEGGVARVVGVGACWSP